MLMFMCILAVAAVCFIWAGILYIQTVKNFSHGMYKGKRAVKIYRDDLKHAENETAWQRLVDDHSDYWTKMKRANWLLISGVLCLTSIPVLNLIHIFLKHDHR